MLGAKICMMAKRGLQLVDRLGGNPGREDLVQPSEAIMKPLQPANALLDRHSNALRLFHRAQPGQGREISISLVLRYRHVTAGHFQTLKWKSSSSQYPHRAI